MTASPTGDTVNGLVETARAAGRGDSTALTALIAVTSPSVWRACAALVDRAAADDLTQDTYLRAIRSLPSYRGDADPHRWLLTIARRVCAEEITRRQRERATLHHLTRQPARTAPGPAGPVELTDALDRLDPPRREALVLTAVLGLSYLEAAHICGCPVGTIRSRVARARADLTTWLWPDTPDPVPVRRAACT